MKARTLSAVFSLWAILACSWPACAQAQNPPAATPAPAPPAPSRNAVPPAPDYPDPRTITIGIFGFATGLSGAQANLITGRTAPDNETLDGIGKARPVAPGIEVSLPITRTGSLHFEGFLAKGDGNTTSPNDTDLFGTTYVAHDPLVTQYQILATKVYLDDLLFPHKFPVAKFRLKSLWELEYVRMKAQVDSPALTAAQNLGNVSSSKQLALPEFGIAAEYALTPHTLFRADAAGFGIPNHAIIWDGNVTLSYRHDWWEVLVGGKTMHFRTSPGGTIYMDDTLSGAYVGVRWHWTL